MARRAARLVVLAALAGAALAPAAPVGARPGRGAPPTYVALGDSYAAGPLVPGRARRPAGCLRSTRNYPHVVAARLRLVLVDATCAGATVAALASPQWVRGGPNPPQLAAVDDRAALVTVTMGGNDLGFGEVLRSCVAVLPVGSPCRDRFGGELSRRVDLLAPRLGAALAEVSRRAPDAAVLVVGYPAVVPVAGPGCWPLLPVAPADVGYLADAQRGLNAALAAQAAAHGATYVDAYGPSAGRDACGRPGRRWVEPLVPLSPAAPVHPNSLGMRKLAALVANAAVAALAG